MLLAIVIALAGLPASTDAAAGDVAQINALEARFAAAFNAKDVDAIMTVYEAGRDFSFSMSCRRGNTLALTPTAKIFGISLPCLTDL